MYAEIDLALCVEPKQFHDVVGGYNRFDIFKLTVNRERLQPIGFEQDGAGAVRVPPHVDVFDAASPPSKGKDPATQETS